MKNLRSLFITGAVVALLSLSFTSCVSVPDPYDEDYYGPSNTESAVLGALVNSVQSIEKAAE